MSKIPASLSNIEDPNNLAIVIPLHICTVISRLNRFVVLLDKDGQKLRAHTNNTGQLPEFMQSGRIAITTDKKPGKTDTRLIGFDDAHLVADSSFSAAIIDTRLQMNCFEVAWQRGLLPFLKGWSFAKRDQKLKNSLIDYLAYSENNDRLLIELKSAVERGENNYGMYPDCPSLRGQRHVAHLTEYKMAGGNSMIVFVSALPGVQAFTPNRDKDPKMGELLDNAKKNGVKIHAISIALDIKTGIIRLMNPDLPVKL